MGNLDPEIIIRKIDGQFQMVGEIIKLEPYGNGHINDTFCVTCCRDGQEQQRYILQRMNKTIFKSPSELMENIVNVTNYLKGEIAEAGGNPERETLTVIRTREGKAFFTDEDGDSWRVYLFIEGAFCLETVERAEDFYNSAVSFGNFQHMLAQYPADTLHETICNFHNTVSRFEDFKMAVQKDVCDRKKEVQQEIEFVLKREADCHVICDALNIGKIPLRVTHNDTKLNNIMMDQQTGKGICVIDLDTVMPGSALYDYGDSIRFGANTGSEDEQNLDLISCDLNLFEMYTKGFVEGCGGSLTEEEICLMPMAAKIMTLECGMRFLSDHLQNDIYFKIHRENHNLDRARTQFKLVADMENKWEQMNEIVRKYL